MSLCQFSPARRTPVGRPPSVTLDRTTISGIHYRGRTSRENGGSAMTQAPRLCALGAALGTEALGIDLAKPLEADTFAWIQAAFAEHPVLVFRDQDLGAPELAAFGRRFGVPRPHALTKYRHVDCPEVSWLTNVEETGKIDWYGV